MSFATALKEGCGLAFKLDISLDNFATISYRYSTHAGIDATYTYDPRIIGLGQLTRALGLDHSLQTSSIDIALGNEDEAADWLCDQATAIDVLAARSRLYIGAYDKASADAGSLSIEWQQLGEYVFSEMPRRTAERITITLADDSVGFVNSLVERPTLSAWREADTSTTTNPFFSYEPSAFSLVSLQSTLTDPIQVAFGDEEVKCWCPVVGTVPSGTFAGEYPIIVCCTTSTAAVAANDVTELWLNGAVVDSHGVSRPQKVPSSVTINGSTGTVWTARKSNTITVDGKSFKVLWIGINATVFGLWYANEFSNLLPINVAEAAALLAQNETFTFWARGYPYSARTVTSQAIQHPADIVRDLVSYYSKGTSSNVDSASLNRVKAAFPSLSAFGQIGGAQDGPDRNLAEHLSELAAGFEMDIFFTWDGKVGLTAALRDYSGLTATLTEIPESRIVMESDGIPSREQRGAPFNRIVVSGARNTMNDAFASPSGETKWNGVRYDDPANTQRSTAWNRVISRELNTRWWPNNWRGRSPWFQLGLDASPRPRVRFRTDLSALSYELGDYFKLSWTRNLGDPYSATVFQVQSLTLEPGDEMTVLVEALWADDYFTDLPYLLDDETLLVVATGSGARTVTVTDGSDTAHFSSGDVSADGVQRGDILLLQDASEGATSFKRTKAVRITNTEPPGDVLFADPLDSYDFDAPTGATFGEWTILRGATTYPTAITDPTNYPDGGTMYGKTASADSAGVFSDSSAANKLLDG